MTHRSDPSRAHAPLLILLAGVSLGAIGCAGGGPSISAGGAGSTTSSSGGGAGGAGGEAEVGATTGAAGGGGDTSCDGPEATIEQVRLGQVPMGERVRLTGVIAMTTKRLIAKGPGSGSCLWGVYVSAPGLTETQQNSGILVADYGFNAGIGPDDSYCPQLGVDPTGDDIPDDVRPGDQLDIVAEGSTLYFGICGSQTQLTLGRVCSAVATGTQPQPTSHVVDIASLSSLEPWEGVKIRAENVHPLLDMTGQIVQQYEEIFLQEGGHIVGFSLDCQPGPPVYTMLSASPMPLFQAIEGIVYPTICGWRIGPVDRCADLVPPSEDCAGLPGC